MSSVTCENCGHTFVAASPQSVGAALTSERRFLDVAPELREAEAAVCAKCGHRQKAQVHKFFGFLPTSAVRVLIGLIVGGMLAFAIWWNVRNR
jgi:hypothetical protein